MKKRLLAALVCVALVVSLLPHTARADNDSPKTLYFESDGQTGRHQLLILDLNTGVKAPYPPGGTWSVSGNTLTLKNFNFTTSAPTVLSMQHNTELKIEGDNSLTSTYDGDGYHQYFVCGLHCADDLTVSGSGALTVTGGSDSSGNHSCGILGAGTLEIRSGTIVARAGTSGQASSGIQMGTITMTGGTLTAYGNTSALHTENSGNCLIVDPAGDSTGLICSYSDNVGETNWSESHIREAIFSPGSLDKTKDSNYYKKPSVRISEVSRVIGTVKDAAGNPVSGFQLYLNGTRPSLFYATTSAGQYSFYVKNGTYTLSAEKDRTIGTRSIAVNGAALSGQDITLENAPTPGITVSPTATFPQGGAPDHLTLLVGNTGNTPNRAAHFGSLEISSDNTNFTTVDSGDYSLRYGSIHIEMSQSFLNTLTPGTYTLRVNLAGAYAGLSPMTRITVTAPGGDAGGAENDVPKTGDAATPVLWLFLMLLAGAGLAVSAACKRRTAKLR